MNRWFLILIVVVLALAGACSRSNNGILKKFPLNNLENVISGENVVFDKDISSDGKGSIRIDAPESLTVSLFNITDLKIDDTRLVYAARVRTLRIIGQVYLGMICFLPGRGALESQGQTTLQSGTDAWKEHETSLDIPSGAKPDSVKLNLIINGRGTVWIDDVRLSSLALPR